MGMAGTEADRGPPPPLADRAPWPLVRVVDGRIHRVRDTVALESPLTLMLNGREWVTLLATPSHSEELVLGFLAAEGVVQHAGEVSRLVLDAEDGRAWIRCPGLSPAARDEILVGRRTLSACCGRGHPGLVFASDVDVPPVPAGAVLAAPERIPAWVEALDLSAEAFHDTGGMHTVGLASIDRDGFWVVRSDVGRHNALDKVAGWCLQQGAPDPGAAAIVFSGRVSAEVVVKAGRLGAGLVVSRAAPTTLGLQMADRLGVTVVAFARGARFGVYTHPERIAWPSGSPSPHRPRMESPAAPHDSPG